MSYDAAPSDNLYMKGLPPGTNEESIKAIFGVYGTVVSVKVLPSPAGVTDSAALVRMASVNEAQYLVDNCAHVASGLGSPVQIKFAHSGQGKGGGGGGGGKGSWAPAPLPAAGGAVSSRLYIKGLPAGMLEDSVRNIIGAYGSIVSIKVLPPPPAGATDSAAIVEMASQSEARWLVENLDGNIPQGLTSPVNIKYKHDGPPSGAASSMGSFAPVAFQDTRETAAPSDNVYMRGLPAGSTEQSIQAIFMPYGAVSSVKVLPQTPGKPDVAALVRMASIDEAKWLVDNLNGNIPQGLFDPINVRFAANPGKPPVATQAFAPVFAPSFAPAAASGAPPNTVPNPNLYMKGLPNDITETTLREVFNPYGKVVSCKVLPPNQAGLNNAAALVQMGTLAEGQWLVENVNNNIPEGLTSPIQIKYAANNRSSGGGGKGPPASAPALGGAWSPAPGPGASTWGPPPPPAAGLSSALAGPSDNLYMKGFPGDTDEQSLRAVLGPYGNIVSVKMLPPPAGKSSAAALVRMSSIAEAKWLVEHLHGNIPQGMSQSVEVKYAANAGAPRKGEGKGGDGGARWAPY